MKPFSFILMLLLPVVSGAQFAPQALVSGSTAISKASAQLSGWATHCTIHRGLQQIGNPGLGVTSVGDSSAATGLSDGSVVSLGDSGVAVLRFARPIRNEAGADFAVFENGFAKTGDPELAFLELAFVEVSSDGINYTRFPATSGTPDTEQISSIGGMSYINARRLNNLAGKYIGTWGTPFDLAELSGTPGLDINAVTHVRIVDVIGDVGPYASFDDAGNVVNDPFPTAFASGGFDLDAVGVLNAPGTGLAPLAGPLVQIYPNPAGATLNISASAMGYESATIFDLAGRQLIHAALCAGAAQINVTQLPAGYYQLLLTASDGTRCSLPFAHQ
jgi:hypothetical protein